MTITRRDILKGITLGAGSVVLAPVLAQLKAHADGAPAPKRFVFVLQSNGFSPSQAQPKGLDRTKDGPERFSEHALDKFELPAGLEPLTPFKNKVTIIQGLNGVHCRPYHGGGYSALSGSREAKRDPLAESIDAALAKALPSVFPMVGLGLDASTRSIGTTYCASAWGAGKPIPTQCMPDLAYQRLFGSVAGGNARKDFNGRAKLLDFMKDDVKRVSNELTGDEKERFDYYLHAYDSMSERLVHLKTMEDALKKNAPTPNENYTSANECKRFEAQIEIAAAALITGLTNVVTLCSGLCNIGGEFPGLGIDIGLHPIGHGQSDKGRSSNELYAIIRRFHIEHIAKLVKRLESVPEGKGTMMDNTVIVYTSDSANAHHADGREWPFVLVGDLGGKLKTGRFLDYPTYGRPGNRTINALYCTLLHAAGAPRAHFNLDGGLKEVDKPGPLGEFLA